MDPKNLAAAGSRTATTNAQFPNFYHLLQNNPQLYQFPMNTMDYRMLHPYHQSAPVFNIGEPLVPINHPFFGFPSVPQGSANLSQWQAPVPSTSSLSEEPLGTNREYILSSNESSPVAPSQQIICPSKLPDKSTLKRKKKFKKRSIQEQLPKKDWNKDDADLALKTECEYGNMKRKQQIIIKFPDEELTADIVKQFHSAIKFVHFQTYCGPRYCFAQIDENVDVNSVIEDLNVKSFQNGCLKAERKVTKEEEEVCVEEIDPYTLYLGNLPQYITSHAVKEKFKKASRIDIGFAQKIKYTRYAFIRFKNVYDAIEAYKENVDIIIDNRSVVLRFRRINNKAISAAKEKKKIKLEEDIIEPDNEFFNENRDKANQDTEEFIISNVEDFDLPTPLSEIKSEQSKGYSDEIINEASSALKPIFGTCVGKNNYNVVSEQLQLVENNTDTYLASGSLSPIPKKETTPLIKFIKHVTGVEELSEEDAELFKTVVLKLANIFKNPQT